MPVFPKRLKFLFLKFLTTSSRDYSVNCITNYWIHFCVFADCSRKFFMMLLQDISSIVMYCMQPFFEFLKIRAGFLLEFSSNAKNDSGNIYHFAVKYYSLESWFKFLRLLSCSGSVLKNIYVCLKSFQIFWNEVKYWKLSNFDFLRILFSKIFNVYTIIIYSNSYLKL